MSKRFTIQKQPFGKNSGLYMLDQQTQECAIILPFLGGSMNELWLNLNGNPVNVIRGYNQDEDIPANHAKSFRSAQLFPFPNRILAGRYSHGGKNYQLPINFPGENCAIHGLIYDRPFSLMKTTEGADVCSLTLGYDHPATTSGYPFRATVLVKYSLSVNGLKIETTITNRDSQEIPVGYGWHPYFRLATPLVNNFRLKLPDVQLLKTDRGLIPTGEYVDFSGFRKPTPIGSMDFDHCLRFSQETKQVITLSTAENNAAVAITLGKDFTHLQLYIPPERDCIALEPMSCPADSFNNGMGKSILQPGEQMQLNWGIGKG